MNMRVENISSYSLNNAKSSEVDYEHPTHEERLTAMKELGEDIATK